MAFLEVNFIYLKSSIMIYIFFSYYSLALLAVVSVTNIVLHDQIIILKHIPPYQEGCTLPCFYLSTFSAFPNSSSTTTYLYGLGYPSQPSPSRELYGAFTWSCELQQLSPLAYQCLLRQLGKLGQNGGLRK